MPIITNLEDKILQLVRSNQYQWFTVGVNLGGVSGEAGGSGIPLGGFTGQLIQSKVTFDTTEAISLDIPASGQSLVHNLNRIRYWIDQKGGTLLVQDEGVEVASGITTLDFVGAPVEVTLSGGKVIVTISGTGEGSGETVKVSSDDTVANYLDNKVTASLPITKVVNNPAGNENLEIGFDGDLDDLSDVSIITAISGQVLAYTDTWLNLSLAAAGISAIGHSHIETDITDLEHDAVKIQGTDVSVNSPSNHDILAYSSGGEWVPSGLSGGAIDVQEDDTPKVSDVTVLNFEGGATVTDEGGGKATILISGGTGGAGYTYVLDDVTGQIPAGGDNFTTAAVPASGSLAVHFNGLTQQPNNYNIITGGFHTLFSPIAGDELVAEYYTDVPSGDILALTLDVEDASTPVASNVEVLNFEGMDVSVDGSTVTISGGTGSGGGGDISVDDEGIEITAGVTSLDFVGDQITATNVGDDVTVTFSGIVVTPPPFVGCRTYRTTDWQLGTTGAWQNLDWQAEEYDTDTMWSTGSNHNVNTAGYYSVIGQVTLSGALPTDSLQFGIFKNSTLISTGWSGFLTTTSGNRTYRLVGEGSFLDTDYIRAQIVCFSGDQPYVISGVANSFLSTHQIKGVFVEGATPEICRVAYTSYLNVNNATDTAIPWSNETYDTGSFWASSPNPSRFTISTDGYYNLKAIGLWESVYYQGVTPFTIRIAFRKNGTTRLANHWEWNDVNTGGARSQGLSTQITADVYLETDDYVEVVVYHEKGSVANGIIRANDTIASIHKIG